MNKRILGAGAASLVLAAMPLLGVFAADTTNVTDTISVTIDPTCTLGTDLAGKTVNKTLQGGAFDDSIEGSTFSVTCNDAGGWHITAVGGDGSTAKTTLDDAAGHSIATGTTIDGSASNWAFKATGTGVNEGYRSFAAIPGSATTIATGSSPVNENKVSITYGVSVTKTQEAGTYSGKVTYTLVKGAEE